MAETAMNKDQLADAANVRHGPHRQTFGVCAPQSVAGDQRALISAPFATLVYLLTHAAGVLTPTRGNTVAANDAAYAIGTAGIGDKGWDLGTADTLTRQDTSFFTDGYPFRDYDFLLRGLAFMPAGIPVRTASTLDATRTASSIGGDARTGGTATAAMFLPMSTTLADPIVNLFFQTTSLQLGFKSESARWDLATAHFHPAGMGLDGSVVPTNGVPVAGRVMKLPFDVQLPRSSVRSNSAGQIIVRQELQHTIVAATSLFANDGTAILTGVGTDYVQVAQQIKVLLIGERVCGADANLLAELMQRYGCDSNVAERLLQDGKR